VKFTDRPDFIYDPAMTGLQDTIVALRTHDEYVRQHSARPAPLFLEVDRTAGQYDTLWHMPTTERTQYSRQIRCPAINTFERPQWNLTQVGMIPQRRDKFWLSNLGLQRVNWFPNRGDFVVWNGYRYALVDVVVPPETYWGQTGVWLGLYVLAIVVPEGDVRPLDNVAIVVDPEMSPNLVPPPPKPQYNPLNPPQLPEPVLISPVTPVTPQPLPINFAPPL
jgi:hypothetical protein